MGKVRLLITLLVLTAGLSGCNGLRWLMGFGGSDPQTENGEPTSSQVLTTTDNVSTLSNEAVGIQVTLPSSWQEDTRLHPSAELQASDPANQLYLVVVAEDEAALNRFGIKENAEKYRTLLIGKLNRSDGQTATDVAFIGSDFATQYEIRGLLAAESPVVYLHTTVLTKNRYYQVVAWTTPDQYQFYKTELQTITESFRETLE
ncbi:MAG: hypothetical protein O2890_13715 [Cyanobacteria bacterium]|nr:hypothetical protein [Cyanobacteriota bacterium]MDA0867436.1 hypothetical protein [Cyanobacteriota bacterium]